MNKMATSNDKFLSDIRNIIDTARTQAVRSVDFCRVQMYWHMGKRIFEEEQQGKSVPITGRTSSRTWPNNWNQSMEAVFLSANWNVAGSFIDFIQLRPQCGRN